LHGSRAGLAGSIAARLRRLRPVIYTAHMFSFHRRLPGALRWAARRAESVTCALSDRVICVSRADLEAAARHGIPTVRFTVVPNAVEAAAFRGRADRREELGFGPGTPVVGMIARLVPQKDPLAFVAMAARVAASIPEARFLIVGDGPLRSRIEFAGRELIRGGRLRLTGWRPDVPELLATLDVAVFPSLWEAQGIALLEAMAASRAVIASRLESHAEAVVDGESGVLFPPGDASRLATEVERLIGDPAARARLARAAGARVERLYTVDGMIQATAGVYRSALAARD
jgi:glycosyltransferase involved in cell wall biosynthesis